LVGGGLSLTLAGAQNPPGGQGRGPQGPNVAEIEKVKDNLFMITGGGGNTAAFITANGVVLVDTKLANWGQPILDKVKTVTDKPVTTIINTHTHGDHNGSNEFFPATVEFVAHENTKTNMEKMDAFKGDKAKFLPKRTYKDKLSLGSGKDQVELYYFGAGHTNGDAFVVFPALRTMHTGDLFAGKTSPIIDSNNGGSAVAYPQTVSKAYAATGKMVDTIITGHSPLMTPADLKEYADYNQDFITWVQGQIKAGKTVDQSVTEYQIPAKYKGYAINQFLGGIKNNIQVAYNELQKK
jgi:glyoxylase-like metal-dependent hydrolase (beta-lactamase superfamily II)